MSDVPKILIIDDDPISSDLLRQKLQTRGFEIQLLHDSKQALENTNFSEYDLLLLDIVMPEVTGIEILKSIRKSIGPIDLPIIMITSKNTTNDITEALEAGANDFIPKPVNVHIASARMSTQLNIKKLNSQSLRAAELSTINSMIITYNHEINNPLTIAMASIPTANNEKEEKMINRLKIALERIRDIVKKIENLPQDNIETNQYSSENNSYYNLHK